MNLKKLKIKFPKCSDEIIEFSKENNLYGEKCIIDFLKYKGFSFNLTWINNLKEYEKSLIKNSRCCGMCDGVNDLCVSDTVCYKHNIIGCEECYGKRN